jgi:hypothetical protein
MILAGEGLRSGAEPFEPRKGSIDNEGGDTGSRINLRAERNPENLVFSGTSDTE